MDTLLAALPLIIILVLMAWLRWGGAQAGAAGWLAALVIAALRFGVTPQALWWAQVQGITRAAYVLYIIWGALLFFRVTEADGTLKAMSDLLQQLSPGRMLQVLLLAWAFASFLQGVGGYGVPVAVVAPIMVTMGFPPLEAVVMPSMGQSWAVSFGSLGASFEALTSATGLEASFIAPWMAAILTVVCLLAGLAVLWVAGGKTALRSEAWPLVTMALAMSLAQYAAVAADLAHEGGGQPAAPRPHGHVGGAAAGRQQHVAEEVAALQQLGLGADQHVPGVVADHHQGRRLEGGVGAHSRSRSPCSSVVARGPSSLR